MKIVEKGNLKYIQFDNINKTGIVRHYFSTRCGGVSENEFYSMNLSFTRGDKRENVIKNFEITNNTIIKTLANSSNYTSLIREITKKDKND